MKRSEIMATARRYLDVPFLHQGCNQFGMDCGGLLRAVHTDLGLGKVEVPAYKPIPQPGFVLGLLRRFGDEIKPADALPGDVLVFSVMRQPQHAGILTDFGMVHADSLSRKVVEHQLTPKWRGRIVTAFAYRGVTNG